MRILLALVTVAMLPFCSLRAQSAGQSSLPPLQNILQQALNRASVEDDNDHQFNQLYHYSRTRITEFHDGKGKLISTEEKKTEEGLGAKRRLQPMAQSVPAQKDETLSASHSNIHGQALRVKDYSLTNLLSRFQFSLVGQDIVNGRATAIVDFKPGAGKLPVHSYKDYFINKAAGRVWVDLEDYAIARAELRLTEKVNVLGGLAGAVWKFTYSLSRERTSEGLWFSRNVDWHLEGREVIFNRIVDYHETKTGEQKVSATMH